MPYVSPVTSSIDSKSQDKSILTKTLDLLNIPQVLYMLVAQTASFMPIMLIQALGPVINMEYFKIRPKENGLFLAGIGAASAVCIVLFNHLCHHYNYHYCHYHHQCT